MADLETAPPGRFRYQRLKYSAEEFESEGGEQRRRRLGGRRSRRWFRIGRALRLKKLIRIPTLAKLLTKKSPLVTAMKDSISKVLKRFRDGEAHFGDLFSGNYLFVHVNPSSIKCLKNQPLCSSKFRPAFFPPALAN